MLFHPLHPLLTQTQPVRLAWLALGSVPVTEHAAQTGVHAVVLDLQHGLWERNAVDAACALAGKHVPVIARAISHAPHHMGQALDSGAASALAPMIETAEQARDAVRACHYPPKGSRSAGGVRPLLTGINNLIEAARHVSTGIMIETVTGVQNVEQILQVPGIDYVFIGPGDLALSRAAAGGGTLEQDCQRVLQAARARGIPCGIYTGNRAAAEQAYAGGFHLAVAVSDVEVIREGFSCPTPCSSPAASS
jgi:2-dehydro-3-deoxyglucarate aldolase/4-hydroxy-2-oxoheptanedioate aldolase